MTEPWWMKIRRKLKAKRDASWIAVQVPGVINPVETPLEAIERLNSISCTVCHKSKELAEYWIALLPGAKSLEFLPGNKVGWDGVCSLKCAEAALGRFLVTARLTGNIYKEPDNGYGDW